ncbi:hypothetical protein CaCOL14_013444 [Colletotrichum acutatum]
MSPYPPREQQQQQQQFRGPYHQTHQYPPSPHAYGTQSTQPQITMASSHPQPIAFDPAFGRVSPHLYPIPAGGVRPQSGMNSLYGPGAVMAGGVGEVDQPTHVVGFQGHREILPSAPGRAAATSAAAGNTKGTVIPVNDADGKYPCPDCNETFKKARQLKSHHQRQTGKFPHKCVLCCEAFSRKDDLKEHFQQCSIRRDNRTGASHLSQPQAHVKKGAAAPKVALGQNSIQEWFNFLDESANGTAG